MADVKEQVMAAIAKNKEKFDTLKAAADDLITSVLTDAQGVIKELETAQEFAGVVIEIVDDNTSSGLFDPIDAPIAKMAIGRIIGEKTEAKYQALRAQALAAEIQ